jgi:hypothetical protein
MSGWWWVPVLSVAACAGTPLAPPRAEPAPVPAAPAVASRWPDVTAALPTDHRGAGDAALIVAIERYPALPAVDRATQSGKDWARFLEQLLGVPSARVTELYGDRATGGAILAGLHEAAALAKAGGRLWVIFVGHGGENLVPVDGGTGDARRLVPFNLIREIAARSAAQPVFVLDLGADPVVGARFGEHPERHREEPATPRSPIIMDSGGSGRLPYDGRPAFSYLMLGALRGWADADGDGLVTASEAVEYARRATHTLRSGRLGSRPVLTTDLECLPFVTLSTLREKAPDLERIAPWRPPPIDAAPEAELVAARGAVARAEERVRYAHILYEARYAGGFPEPSPVQPRYERDKVVFEAATMPRAVQLLAEERVHYAALLGGPSVFEAARELVLAATEYLRYGHPARAEALARPVLEARCTLGPEGVEAWSLLVRAVRLRPDAAAYRELMDRECFYDAESERMWKDATGRMPRGIQSTPGQQAYYMAEKTADPELAACYWADAANRYERALRAMPARPEAPEAAMNGGYAFRKLGRFDDAAALYELYLQAQSHGIPGDDARTVEQRHRYSVMACEEFQQLLGQAPALRPRYLAVCDHQDWRSCEEGDAADCAPP